MDCQGPESVIVGEEEKAMVVVLNGFIRVCGQACVFGSCFGLMTFIAMGSGKEVAFVINWRGLSRLRA